MSKFITFISGLLFLSLTTRSQATTSTVRECRISSGVGFASATTNMKQIGPDFWLQLDYKLQENFSIAFEFENGAYKQPGYFTDLPVEYKNEIAVVNNSFSFLVKYHVKLKSKLKLALASGWTYNLRSSEYYDPPYEVNSQFWPRYFSTLDDFRIPFVAEAHFPISKSFDLMTRVKYNLNRQNGGTYSAGMGISLKL